MKMTKQISKKNSRLITMLMAVVLVITAMPVTVLTANATMVSGNTTEFAGGIGIDEDPYLIATKEHLDNVRKYTSSSFKMINDIEFVDSDFERGGQYYNGGRYWLPIEDFSGTFNGNGKTISSLKGPGVFGDVYNADISNLHVEKHIIGPIKFISSIYEWNDGYCAGGIACAIKDSTISNCSGTEFTVSVTKEGPVGGLIGVAYSSTIKNCEFKINNNSVMECGGDTGLICAFAESSTFDKCETSGAFIEGDSRYFGGIVGLARTCSITNCENTVTIKNTGSCGGIVGDLTYGGYHSNSGIVNCKNSGDISGGDRAGGIAGVVYDEGYEITSCENEGTISATGREGVAGGIFGIYNNYGIISNCTNSGKVSGYIAGGITGRLISGFLYSMHNSGEVIATFKCGGIAGESHSEINESSNIGTVKLSSNSSEVLYIGGIAGRNTNSISKCYNTGKIEANCNSAKVGGIAGENESSGEIKDSYNIGDIKCDYTGNQKIYTIGGICGENKQPMQAIVNCYNIGSVPNMDDDIGLICGNNTEPGEAFKNCYVVEGGVTDVGFGYGDGSATRLTEEQMCLASNFSGFDFNSVWTMAGNADYLYPELKDVEMMYVSYVLGDIDGIEGITDADAEYMLMYTFFPEDYPVNQECDFNGDGKVNDADAEHLLMFTFFPEDYPLN